MKYLLFTALLLSYMNSNIIFDFSKDSNIRDWIIVDDIVMGGKSLGSCTINEDGHGVFEGNISLENYGGFSSIRYQFEKIEVNQYSKIVLKIRGDGKKYQFRVKADQGDYYSFISYFNTSGEWQEIEIPLNEMYPTFRGRELDMPNFSGNAIQEIGILFGNKKKEGFKLLIDKIELR